MQTKPIMKQCVKCGYIRQPAETAPESECPKCGVIYAKAEAALEERLRKARESEQNVTERAVATTAGQIVKSDELKYLPAESINFSNANNLTVECPYCAEQISPKAKKCRHCGEMLDATLRELEVIKSMKQNVYMNAGGGGGGAAAVAATPVLKAKFPHFLHLFMSVITFGSWAVIWLLHYIFRDRNHYG